MCIDTLIAYVCTYVQFKILHRPVSKQRYNKIQNVQTTFQIKAYGGNYVRSGYAMHFRYVNGGSRWLKCTQNNRCVPTSFTRITSQALYFNRCTHERLYIYARGCQTGDIIYNGDVIMIVQENRAVSLQEINHSACTSMSY